MSKWLSKKNKLLGFFLLISMVSFSQELSKKITVKDQALSVFDICTLLKKEYKIKIAYSNNDEQLQIKIIIKAGVYNINGFLEATLKNNKIKYQLTDQQLIIIPVVKRSNSDKSPITISGFVEDEETGEKLPGASIYIPNTQKGTITNNYGFFTITVSENVPELVISYAGYELYKNRAGFDTDMQLIVKLKANKNLEEVVVTSTSSKRIPLQDQTQMSKINVPVSIIKSAPRFLGEADVIKTLLLLPGISQGTEATSGMLVRGGTPDQNLILLDGTPIYNASHAFGIFSTFNPNALKSVDVYKGGFPARFGSRLSSVIDIVTKDGNMKELHGEASIGLLTTNLTLEGPLKKNKTSFIVSGRRTYIDLIAAPIIKSLSKTLKKVGANFYDVNLKLHHIISPKDRLFFSLYSGNDKIKFNYQNIEVDDYAEQKFSSGWGNIVSAVRWNHVFTKKLFANTLVNYTRYKMQFDYFEDYIKSGDEEVNGVKYNSSIYDIGSRIDFDYRPLPEHNIKFGTSALQHTFTPGILSLKKEGSNQQPIDTTYNNYSQKSAEFSIYAEDDWKVFSTLNLNAGVHASTFKAKTRLYSSVQPRIALRYLLPKDIALKASYSHMNQYIHLLANNTLSLPTDLWVPSTDKVKPMLSRQVTVGFAKSVWNNKIDISLEGYYKTMDGVIEYLDGSGYLNSSTAVWDSKVEAGVGKVRGIELLVQKNVGRTKGWIGYTLSHNSRVFPTINYGKQFDYKYDRRHDFELVVTHSFNPRCEISGSWQFQTAMPFTVPSAQYEAIEEGSPYEDPNSGNGVPVNYIKGRNQFRLLNYHRLDIGITWKKKKRHYERLWNLGLYNAYNKQNPFYYYLDGFHTNSDIVPKILGPTLLPILPSISYTVKF